MSRHAEPPETFAAVIRIVPYRPTWPSQYYVYQAEFKVLYKKVWLDK